MKKLLILIIGLIFLFQTSVILAENGWLAREKNPKGEGCWVLYKHGTITKVLKKGIEVPEPEADWTIREYPKTENIIKVAFDSTGKTRWHYYSDGTYTVFLYNEQGRVERKINTERGIQHKFYYHPNGRIKADVHFPTKRVELYREIGGYDRYIYEDRVAEMVYDETGSYITKNRKPTEEEKKLWKKCMLSE